MKKLYQRILSMVLSLSMLLSMGVTAGAVDGQPDNTKSTQDSVPHEVVSEEENTFFDLTSEAEVNDDEMDCILTMPVDDKANQETSGQTIGENAVAAPSVVLKSGTKELEDGAELSYNVSWTMTAECSTESADVYYYVTAQEEAGITSQQVKEKGQKYSESVDFRLNKPAYAGGKMWVYVAATKGDEFSAVTARYVTFKAAAFTWPAVSYSIEDSQGRTFTVGDPFEGETVTVTCQPNQYTEEFGTCTQYYSLNDGEAVAVPENGMLEVKMDAAGSMALEFWSQVSHPERGTVSSKSNSLTLTWQAKGEANGIQVTADDGEPANYALRELHRIPYYLSQAGASKAEVKLCTDLTAEDYLNSLEILPNTELTFDLAGHTVIWNEAMSNAITFRSGGSLTLVDSVGGGQFISQNGSLLGMSGGGTETDRNTLTIQSGTYVAQSSHNMFRFNSKFYDVVVNGGTFEAKGGGTILHDQYSSGVESRTITVNGGKFYSETTTEIFRVNGFSNENDSSMVINDCYAEGKGTIIKAATRNYEGTLCVKGGEFRTSATTINASPIPEIQGGRFYADTTEPSEAFSYYADIKVPDGMAILYSQEDGCFQLMPLPEVTDNGTLSVTTSQGEPEAFTSVTDAFNAVAQTGGTITLNGDSTFKDSMYGLTISRDVVLDLNGHTLTVDPLLVSNLRGCVNITGGSLTVQDSGHDGMLKLDGEFGVTFSLNAGQTTEKTNRFTLIGGKIEAGTYGVYYSGAMNADVISVEGGKLTAVMSAVTMMDQGGIYGADYSKACFSMEGGELEALGTCVSLSGLNAVDITGGSICSSMGGYALRIDKSVATLSGDVEIYNVGDSESAPLMLTSNYPCTIGGTVWIHSGGDAAAIQLFTVDTTALEIRENARIEGKTYAIESLEGYDFRVSLRGGHYKYGTIPFSSSKNLDYATEGNDTYILSHKVNSEGDYKGYYDLVLRESLKYTDENGIERKYQELDDLAYSVRTAQNALEDADNYTAESIEALRQALEQAVKLLEFKDDGSYESANLNANQAEVDYYCRILDDARKGLQGVSDLDPVHLADGSYSVSISMLRTVSGEGTSMASGAVDSNAVLIVDNGQYTLQLRFRPLYLMGAWGHLLYMWQFKGETREDALANAGSFTGDVTQIEQYARQAQVLFYYTKDSTLNNMVEFTGDDPQICEDGKNGNCYPWVVAIPLEYVSKETEEDSTYRLRVAVDMMRQMAIGDQNVDLYVQWDTLQPTNVKPTLALSTTEVSLIAGSGTSASQTVTATLQNADGYILSVNSENAEVATATIVDGAITITAKGEGQTTVEVKATKGSAEPLTKTIAVTVAGSGSTAAGVSTPEVSDNTATATIFGDTIVTNGSSDKVTVTEDEITFDVKASSTSVDKAMVTLSADTADALEKSGKDVVIETDVGSVSLDDALLDAVAGKNAAVTLTVAEATMPIGIGSFEAAYDLILTANNTAIDFGSGKATVTVATELTSGYAYHIQDGKKVEKQPLTIVNGTASWTTTHFSTWALSASEYEVDSGSGTPGGNPGEDEYFLTDGNYYVDIALWKADSNEESMGNVAFKNNDRALVTVEDGEITTVQIATNPVDVSGYHSAIITFEVEGAAVRVLETGDLTTTHNGEIIQEDYTYVKLVEFTMPSAGQPEFEDEVTYLPVTFYVPDTPMDSVVDATNGLNARIKFTWSTASATSDSSLEQDDSSATGTSSITGEEIVDVNLTDKDTGIKLITDSERLSNEAALSVEKLTSGSDYDTAVKAMSGITDSWSLYNITALVDGKITAPEGSVTLSIPCTKEGLTVYRINASGTKTVLKGEVKDGYYVLNTSSLGLFAIVGVLGEARELPFTDVETGSWYYDGVKYAVEKGLFAGTSATTFAPNMELTRAMLVTVLYRLAGSPEVSQFDKFSDVQADSWYEDAVTWAAANGVVAGYGGGVFGPDDDITREQLALILYRYAQLTEQDVDTETDLSAYSDVGEVSDFAREAMVWAVENGLISGTSKTTLSPKGTATRAQVAVILMRYLEQPDK